MRSKSRSRPRKGQRRDEQHKQRDHVGGGSIIASLRHRLVYVCVHRPRPSTPLPTAPVRGSPVGRGGDVGSSVIAGGMGPSRCSWRRVTPQHTLSSTLVCEEGEMVLPRAQLSVIIVEAFLPG